jgi:hypothetical protein
VNARAVAAPESERACLADADAFALAARLGCLVLVLDPPLHWFERVPLFAAAGAALLVPAALRSRALWLLLTALASGPLVWGWPFPDNHDYLTALFCLAVACALASDAPGRALARSARGLVGVTFAFAILWKVALSPDFLDGTFFRVTLLTDHRFENLAVLLGGMTWTQWESNSAAIDAFLAGEAAAWPAAGFVEPPRLVLLAQAATAYTVLLEAWVAVAFLAPRGARLARSRDAALLLFLVTTYPFATVRGFGWILATLGLAQCAPSSRATRLAYLASAALIEVYRSVPWDDALVVALGRT